MDKETEKVVLNIKWNLRACRVNANFTQQEAADKLHISVVTLNGHGNNRINPSYAQLLAYSVLYEVPIEIINAEVRD